MSAITEDHVRDLYDHPDATLVLVAGGPVGYTARVVAEDDITPGMVRVHDQRDGVQTPVTHAWVRAYYGPSDPRPDDPDWADRIAYHLLPHAAACWARHERGDDALGAELGEDPTAFTRYVI